MAGGASVLRARRDVYKAFQIWQQVNRTDQDVISGNSTTKILVELIDGHVAARCALARPLPRILAKVKLDYDTQLRLMISILAALAEGPDVLRETSAENIMHLLQGLLSQPRFKTSSEASSKSTFKFLVLNMFRLSAVSKQAHNSVVKLASTAFESRPYTFMIALTDALEDENHPALKGAVSFANDAFLADLRESGLFLRVMKSEPDAAPQVAMLLQSCMKDMQQRGRLPESLHVMSELDQGLRRLDPNLGTPIPATPTSAAAALRPVPQSPLPLGKRERTSIESTELPGPPPRVGNAAPSGLPASYAPAHVSKDELPPPPKRRSTPRRSVTSSPPPADRRRTTPFAPQSWRSCPALAQMTTHTLIGDVEREDHRISMVGPSICIHSIPQRAYSRDLVRAMSGTAKLLHAEVLPSHCALLQFSSMAAAVACFSILGRALDRLGWRSCGAAFASPEGAMESARGENWIWVACKPSKLAFEGIMRVLHSDGIETPTSYHLSPDSQPNCASGCLLLCTSQAHAQTCIKRLRQWVEAVPNMKQAVTLTAEEPPSSSAVARSPSPKTAQSAPEVAMAQQQTGPLWAGSVAKGTIPQCRVCISVASPYAARGCKGWPAVLDMQHRIMMPQAMDLWKEHDPDHRGWAWMQPDGDQQAFDNFVQYLCTRDRAGIVRPPVEPDVLFHTLYLIPAPSEDMLSQVGASKEGASQLLMLLQTSQAPTG